MLKNNLVKIDINNKNFYNILKLLINFNSNKKIIRLENYIKNIIYNINYSKEKSLKFYLKKFEKNFINNIKEIKIEKKILEKSFYNLSIEDRFNLELAKNRIEIFHKEQKKNLINNWKIIEENGNIMGQKNNNIDKIGFYIPGGKNIYPSTVFMNIIPSFLNSENITVCFPKKLNNDFMFSTLFICNIKNVFSLGGVAAITSMAYGNKIIERVDKICGPGNIYVTLSKKHIYGVSGIDMLAGPSEITVIADSKSNFEEIVFDLFSQSEHDKMAQSILISDSYNLINNVEKIIKGTIPFLYKKNIIYNSIFNNIIIIKVNNLNESFNILNYISPEHLIISLENSLEFLKNIKNSGSNFIDNYTVESFGDYTAGPNHVIPTNKNSKFSSPLGSYDFYKKLSFLKVNKLCFKKLYNTTLNFSKKEKLYSHFDSVKYKI